MKKTFKDSQHIIRIKNHMPEVYEANYLYLHYVESERPFVHNGTWVKHFLEFLPFKRDCAKFSTKEAFEITKVLVNIGYKNIEPIDIFAD